MQSNLNRDQKYRASSMPFRKCAEFNPDLKRQGRIRKKLFPIHNAATIFDTFQDAFSRVSSLLSLVIRYAFMQ
jgi:transposase